MGAPSRAAPGQPPVGRTVAVPSKRKIAKPATATFRSLPCTADRAKATPPSHPRDQAAGEGTSLRSRRHDTSPPHERTYRRHRRPAAWPASAADRSESGPPAGPAGEARPPRAAPAAGDPRRRHQRQRQHLCLPARDRRGGRIAHARLYLAAPRALQRTHPHRRRTGLGPGPRRSDGTCGAGECRCTDHRVRGDHRGSLPPVRADAGRVVRAGSWPGRTRRRHQRDSATGCLRYHLHFAGPPRTAWQYAGGDRA